MSASSAVLHDAPARSHRLALTIAVAALALVADLMSKAWAWHVLRDAAPIALVENWAYFEFGFNSGAAFSLFRDVSWARLMFILVTLGAVGYMSWLAITLPTRWRSGFVAVGLIAAGALGNLHDRLFRMMEVRGELRHGVVDFIKVYYWPGKSWPTFNVADIVLVVGVGMLLLYITRHGEALQPVSQPAPENA